MRLHLTTASFTAAQRAKAKGQAVMVLKTGWWIWTRWKVWIRN